MSTQIALLKKYGLPIRGNIGQHLLIDPNIQKKIVDLLDLSPKDKVLEIGPGLGALTGEVLSRGAEVWAVEKDKRFVEILEGELGADYKTKLHLICGDILKLRFPPSLSLPLHPAGGGLGWGRGKGEGEKFKVIGNLPYYITTPVLFYLIENRRFVKRAVLTMQREVARRLLATPGTKDYGRPTLAFRYYADIDHAFDISPHCFTPKPRVASSVLVFTFHPDSQLPKDIDEKFLFHLIEIAFSRRRKTFLRLLASDSELGISRERLTAIFKSLGWPLTLRGEELLLKDFLNLAEKLRRGAD